MNQKKICGILLAVLMAAAGALFLFGRAEEEAFVLEETAETAFRELADPETETAGTSREAETAGTIRVHVCGEVNTPGVVELAAGSCAADAVEAAGGFTERAAPDGLNLARALSDGEQVRVPDAEEAASAAESEAVRESGRIDINSATREQLMSLPGIGEVRAEAIIAYRTEHGPFSEISELMNVSGIGESILKQIEDRITAG